MRTLLALGFMLGALLSGCASMRPAAPAHAATPAPSATVGEPRTAPAPAAQPGVSEPAAAAQPAAVAPPPPAPAVRPDAAPPPRSAANPAVPVQKTAPEAPASAREAPPKPVAKATVPALPPTATPVPVAVSKPAAPPAPPSLDLAALEQRLRDTRAVGVFTKLSLKNQVDDLLAQVRSYYRGKKPPPPAELRPRFDGLLLKVLSVVQDGDPPLATQIWSSREAIWGVLADPTKFERI